MMTEKKPSIAGRLRFRAVRRLRASSADDRPQRSKRRRLLVIFGGTAGIIALTYGVWALIFSGHTVSTDNAYTAVEVAQVTPLVGGPVVSVEVIDSQIVRAGDVLVRLDETDSCIAVDQAVAELTRARRRVRQLMANDVNLEGLSDMRAQEIRSAKADRARARANLDKAILDEKRRRNLIDGGAVSEQELTNAETELRDARAAIEQAEARVRVAQAAKAAAEGARQANDALIADSTVDTNPEVQAAAAKLKQARVNLARMVIRAPVAGVVTQRSVDVGQHVQAGAHLMSIVPIESIYVDVNFKEGELRDVRLGQHVKLISDLYGNDVVYDGRVQGFAGGTGSAFAAIPAQNATGNWIKVVQRLPVRVRLDPQQLAEHPLRVGLSMRVTVDLASPQPERVARR
jgi:membrane fusion protein (multidrug efflux system)